MKKAAGKFLMRLGEKLALGWDAGESKRIRKDLGWGRATPCDEDAMLGKDGTRELIRQKCNDLRRNHPIAAGLGDRIALFALGSTGLTPQWRTRDAGWNRAAEDWWKQIYAPAPDSRGISSLFDFQRMAISLRPTHGGLYFERLADGKIRPLETERIRNPQKNAQGWYDGVKKDAKTGAILAYCAHARDINGGFGGPHEEVWIESSNMIKAIRPAWRPDSSREFPDLAPIVPALQDIGAMNENTLNTAKIQSQYIGFLKKEGGNSGSNSGWRGSTVQTAGERQTFKTEWGQILHGNPNEDLSLKNSPTPGANHIPYMKLQYMLCGSAVGFPYEFLTLDLSPLDYSRMKGLLLLVNFAIRPWQSWLVDTFLNPLALWRIPMEMKPGGSLYTANPPVDEKNRSEFWKVDWQGPTELWIDRQESQQSDTLEIQSCLGTLEQAARRRGLDLETSVRSNARSLKMIERIAQEEGVEPDRLFHMQIPGQTFEKEEKTTEDQTEKPMTAPEERESDEE